MLVRRDWLEKADAHITKQDAPDAVEYGAASRFYDVRPARLQTAWSQNQAGVWVATARFVVNDAVDNSFTFPVYAPTATSSPGGTAESTRFFVVWRGRWEMIAGAGNGVSSVTKKTIKAFSEYLLSTVKFFTVKGTSGTPDLRLLSGVRFSGNSIYFDYTNVAYATPTSTSVVTDVE